VLACLMGHFLSTALWRFWLQRYFGGGGGLRYEGPVISLVSLFWKNKSRLIRSPLCLCLCIPTPLSSWIPEPIFMKLGMYNMVPETISIVYFINSSHQSVCMCIPYRCWATARTRRFLCGPCHIKGESVGLSVYTPIVARQWLGKHVPAETKNYWRYHFLCGPCRIKEKQAISSFQNFLSSITIDK
jgi:hypothetical protein